MEDASAASEMAEQRTAGDLLLQSATGSEDGLRDPRMQAFAEFHEVAKQIPLPPAIPSTSAEEWKERTALARVIAKKVQEGGEGCSIVIMTHSANDAAGTDLNGELFIKHYDFISDFLKTRYWHIDRFTATAITIVRRAPHPDAKWFETV